MFSQKHSISNMKYQQTIFNQFVYQTSDQRLISDFRAASDAATVIAEKSLSYQRKEDI